jgi:hypothetical protein
LSRYVSRLSEKVVPTNAVFPMRSYHPRIERRDLDGIAKAHLDDAPFTGSSKGDFRSPLGHDHRKMAIRSVINPFLWGQAGWTGVLYASAADAIPVLGLIFSNEDQARHIFKGSRARFGEEDKNDEIHISIVRDIWKEYPNHYAMVITSQMPDSGVDNVLIASRIHRMRADSRANLDAFLAAYQAADRYILLPVVVRPEGPHLLHDLPVGKHRITVKRASEVGPNDIEQMALRMDNDHAG